MTAVRTFAQTLRRYTTVRAVLQNYTQINQMLTDLNHVDFRNIQEQVRDYDIFVFINFFLGGVYLCDFSFCFIDILQ